MPYNFSKVFKKARNDSFIYKIEWVAHLIIKIFFKNFQQNITRNKK